MGEGDGWGEGGLMAGRCIPGERWERGTDGEGAGRCSDGGIPGDMWESGTEGGYDLVKEA